MTERRMYAPVAMTASMTFSRVARDCLRERWLYTLGCSATMDAKKLSLDVSIARCSRPVLPCSHHAQKHKCKHPTTVSNASTRKPQRTTEGREGGREGGKEDTHKRPHINTIQDTRGELVPAQRVDDRLRARVGRGHDRGEHALDLVQAVLERLDVALGRAPAEARRCVRGEV